MEKEGKNIEFHVFWPSLHISVKLTSFQVLGHQLSDWILSNRLPESPIDCPFVQAIASCLRPSNYFLIQIMDSVVHYHILLDYFVP